jgi:acyl-CoA thioesterase I
MKKRSLQCLAVYSLQKVTFLVFTFAFCLFTFLGCAKREIKNINSTGKNIICFGDSMTFGVGANPGEDYPAVLSKMIEMPVINAGVDGETSPEALKRIDSDALDREPLLVVIEFGGNDFLRQIPLEVTANNIKAMVEKIQAKGAMVAIVDISVGLIMGAYRAPLYNLAKEKDAIFIPKIFSDIFTNPSLKSDFIHPNADGYKIIAQRVYRVITPYLNKNSLARKFGK